MAKDGFDIRQGAAAGIGRIRSAIPSEFSDPNYRWTDRIGLAMCWLAGISLIVISSTIVLWLFFKGVDQMSWKLLSTNPLPNFEQIESGGILAPILGTVILGVLGTLLALPLGIATAVWLVEYGKPAGLARAVESGVEIVSGSPSIVLAIFGLAVFTQQIFGFLSFSNDAGAVFGRSFLVAAVVMSLLALPLIVGSTREALQRIPSQVREASYALGKSKATTIRRVLLPMARQGVATGGVLGMGRIVGDTAIVFILLGGSLTFAPTGEIPGLDILRGTGSTLTTYVYGTSPAGEGNSPDKAYAAGFLLLMIVLVLNLGISRIAKRNMDGAATK